MEQLVIYGDKVKKRRKSISRIDKENKKSSTENSIDSLGLQNFKEDLLSTKSLYIDLEKADNSHLPEGAERCAYEPIKEYGVIYIPVNRLKQIYQTDEATDWGKVSQLVTKMKNGTPLPPVEIGYNYDVHDGHHRWEASKVIGYTHVPCKVVGTDKEKVLEARKKYREVWKSFEQNTDEFLAKSLDDDIQKSVLDESEEEVAFENYARIVDAINNSGLQDELLRLSINSSGLDNLNSLLKSTITEDLAIVIPMDIAKSRELHKGKLVKRRIPVKGKDGKTFYRMQWVDPNDKKAMETSQPHSKDEKTYGHHEDGIKDLEKKHSNKFPVRHIPLGELKNTDHNYQLDKDKYKEALEKYHNGEKLPPVKISSTGEILDHPELVDLAKNVGMTHVPVIIMGNSRLKKELEDKLKDSVMIQDENSSGDNLVRIQDAGGQSNEKPEPTEDMINDMKYFDNVLKHIYPRSYLMEQAREHDIVWKEYTNNGDPLDQNSNIYWMNCVNSIKDYITSGGTFTIKRNEKEMDRKMQSDGKGGVDKAFLKLLGTFNGDKQELMDWCEEHSVDWKYHNDPSKNWMNFCAAIKKELGKGRMINGIRTRLKDAMEESNMVITDQIKDQVRAYSKKHGKASVMNRAEDLGIVFDRFDSKGNPLDDNSNILWMRASEAIQKYIAKGNEFRMAGEVRPDDGINATIGDHGGLKLSKMQKFALDVAKRNSQNFEKTAHDYAINCFKVDRNVTDEQAEELYKAFQERARNARFLVHFDPLEKLPSGVNLIDQLTSDGEFKNDYYLKRGWDEDRRGANENAIFTNDYYETPDSERPNYMVVDLLNNGLNSNKYGGEVAFVLKSDSDTVKRSTGSAIDADSLPYGEDGKWVKSMEDPHQLLVDRWYSKWKKPKGADGQRRRAMDAVLNGTSFDDGMGYFEGHLHGGLDFKRDIDHLLVPTSWQTDKQHAEKHKSIQAFGKLMGIPIKYE